MTFVYLHVLLKTSDLGLLTVNMLRILTSIILAFICI